MARGVPSQFTVVRMARYVMTCAEGKTHYSVTSPEMSSGYSGYGPPEYGCDWALVLASNKREARLFAVKGAIEDGDFQEWVSYARADGINPFSGVKVEPSVCEHGVCWGCEQSCISCRRADDLDFLNVNKRIRCRVEMTPL